MGSTGRMGGCFWGVLCVKAEIAIETSRTNLETRRCTVAHQSFLRLPDGANVPGREFHPLKSSAFHGALLRQLPRVLAEELPDELEVIRAENRHGAMRISLTVLPVVYPAETLVEFPLQIRHNEVRNQ